MNTSSVIKKMFLYIIMFIMQKNINHTCIKYTTCFATYRMGTVKQINIKNRTFFFTMI